MKGVEVKELLGRLEVEDLAHTEYKNEAKNAQKSLENKLE